MNCNNYYDKFIKPKYLSGFIQYSDEETIFSDNNNLNYLSNYEDFTHLNVYSIDPDGCEDVDDAFSFYTENNKKYIVIHIADPTAFINTNSDFIQKLINNAFTRYPSNNKPIHLMPNNILHQSSLHLTENDDYIKNALSIFIEFDDDNNLIFNNSSIHFTKIKINPNYKFSYSNVPCDNDDINNCLNLSEHIFPNLVYNDVELVIKYSDNKPFFYICNDNEKKYKKMIAKFAIFSNNYIAYFLKQYLPNNHIIFRSCPIVNNDFLSNNITFDKFISYILNNNISAEYSNSNTCHDLLELNEYLHMTSPLRRSVDCIIHYLLKNIVFNLDLPFDIERISDIINQSNIVHKNNKNIQFDDNKFRFLQTMANNIHECNNRLFYTLTFKVNSYFVTQNQVNNSAFINILVYKLDEFNIYFSYTLKLKSINETMINNIREKLHNIEFKCNIYNVYPCKRFDEGKLPDLDNFIYKILKM